MEKINAIESVPIKDGCVNFSINSLYENDMEHKEYINADVNSIMLMIQCDYEMSDAYTFHIEWDSKRTIKYYANWGSHHSQDNITLYGVFTAEDKLKLDGFINNLESQCNDHHQRR